MSEENVALVREAFSRYQAGDPNWATDWINPEIGWDFSAYPLADLPSKGRGRDELLGVIATYLSGWVDLRQELIETIDAGDHVVVIVREIARLRDSDAELKRDVAHVWTVRDRLWVRWRIYPDRDAALKAAGVEG